MLLPQKQRIDVCFKHSDSLQSIKGNVSMKKSIELIDEILEIIGPIDDKEEKDRIDAIAKNFFAYRSIINIILFCHIAVFFILKLIIKEDDFLILIFGISMASFLLLYSKRKKAFGNELTRYIFDDCCADKGLSRIYYYLPLLRNKRITPAALYLEAGSALANMGRFDDTAKIIRLIDSNCNSAVSILYRQYLISLIAEYYNEFDILNECVITANKLSKKLSRYSIAAKLYDRMSLNADISLLLKQEKFQELYNMLSSYFSTAQYPLREVSIAYYLYHLLNKMGDRDKALEYKKYVLENGGAMWYKKALEDAFEPGTSPDVLDNYSVRGENC
ncbi:hypothetical protein SAMN02910342_01331 [Butyrivibrio sp. INlla21]|nr:hypothetical protein SAMN02910342_01331 [Butyrivibrio sp. INlla21]